MKRIFVITLLLGHWIYLSIRPLHSEQVLAKVNKTYSVNAYQSISDAENLVKEGDVVRLNTDPASQIIKNFNRKDKKYSHAGIVLFENGHPCVYHIVNGSENPEQKIRKDSLARFCDPGRNFSFGIFRYSLTAEEIKNVKSIVGKWYLKAVSFDNRFDLKTDNKMYCSEMVSKAFAKATCNRIPIRATKLARFESSVFGAYSKLPFDYMKKLEIISIDDLYHRPFCTRIKEYQY